MQGPYMERSLEPVLLKAAREFPAVVLTGPRQSGKTTILKRLFADSHRYVSLEPPDIGLAASEDPRGFIEAYGPPVIFDEVQYAPDLLPYVKERIDAARDETGQFLLTGSQNLLLMERITESLAGRTAILRLLPMSNREATRQPQRPLPWEPGQKDEPERKNSYKDFWHNCLRGGYPELVAHPSRDIGLWHAGYIQTYLERDVRLLRQVGDLSQFQIFLRALAARSAQLLNIAEMARDLGVAVNTAKAWLSVLEATYQVIVLRPYYANVGKRLVKTPKVYFADVGTLCHLAGLKDPDHAASGPMGGAIMETMVLTEVIRTLTHKGIEPEVYFWRTSAGTEVDIVVAGGGKLIPLEVKLSATPRPKMAASIGILKEDLGNVVSRGYVVHPGDVRIPLAAFAKALPFAEL